MCVSLIVCITEPVEELNVWPHGGQLWLNWKSPKSPSNRAATEYVVEWVHGDHIDWQRENRTTRQTVIKGNLFLIKNVDILEYLSRVSTCNLRKIAPTEDESYNPIVVQSVCELLRFQSKHM